MRPLPTLPRLRGRVGRGRGPSFESVSMRTLYDLLGVGSDADDEALNKAFRQAAKAHHPDLNAGDPDAARRFRQIATAIEILREGVNKRNAGRLPSANDRRRSARPR